MKRRGIEFYTIGTGDSPNAGELSDIATDPDSEHDFRSVQVHSVILSRVRLVLRLWDVFCMSVGDHPSPFFFVFFFFAFLNVSCHF